MFGVLTLPSIWVMLNYRIVRMPDGQLVVMTIAEFNERQR